MQCGYELKEKYAKHFYPKMQGYFTITLKRDLKRNDLIERARLSEMVEEYKKLHCKTTTDLRDASK